MATTNSSSSASQWPVIDSDPDSWKRFSYPVLTIKQTGSNQDPPITSISAQNSPSTAREDKPSLRWNFSGASGRACSTIFTSAIAGRLTDGLMDKILEDENEGLGEAMNEVFRVTFGVLERLDRMSSSCGDESHIENQDGELGRLPTLSKDRTIHPGNFLNRDPNVPELLRCDFKEKYEIFKKDQSNHIKWGKIWVPISDFENNRTIDGNKDDLPSQAEILSGDELLNDDDTSQLYNWVIKAVSHYFDSNPGLDEAGPNASVHMLLSNFQNPHLGNRASTTTLQEAYQCVKYRLDIMDIANQYVAWLGIGLPNGPTCEDFDSRSFSNVMSSHPEWRARYGVIRKSYYTTYNGKMFPQAWDEAVGFQFVKGGEYLVAALYCTEVPQKEWEVRLRDLCIMLDEAVVVARKWIKDFPDVKAKRQKFAEKASPRALELPVLFYSILMYSTELIETFVLMICP